MSPDHAEARSVPPGPAEPEPSPAHTPGAMPNDAGPTSSRMWLPCSRTWHSGASKAILPAMGGQPSPLWYPIAYAVKVALVAALCWWYQGDLDRLPAMAQRSGARSGRALRRGRLGIVDRP